MALTPLPPRPIPGSETFEADAGALLDALPVFGDELNDLQEDVADKQALAASDRTQTGLDRVATGEDRVQTGLDRVQTGLDRVQAAQQATAAAGSASTVLAVNTVAQTQAAAAASSAGQAAAARDAAIAASAVAASPTERLSAISSAIHSGTVVKAIIYDTSKDSDGGQWRKRCTDKSWYTEEVQTGKWLGRAATEAGARAISGAVANDYYQNTTDNKFYRLNASGQTEVFRGNTREFPAVAGIVAEATRVVIYDMAALGCPMWRVFSRALSSVFPYWWKAVPQAAATAVAALHGVIFVGVGGGDQPGVLSIELLADKLGVYRGAGGGGVLPYPIAQYNPLVVPAISIESKYSGIAAHTVSDVAATVLPDAPADPATGLTTPTIAVATVFGISVIRHDGTIQSEAITRDGGTTLSRVAFDSTGGLFIAHASTNRHIYFKPAPYTSIASNPYSANVGASFVAFPGSGAASTTGISPISSHTLAHAGGAGVSRIAANNSQAHLGAVTRVTNAYNTGWLVGDNRLATLSDSVAETVVASGELFTNGTFDVDTTGWEGRNGGSLSIVGGKLRVTNTGGYGSAQHMAGFQTIVGKRYRVTLERTAGTASGLWALGVNNVGDVSIAVNINQNNFFEFIAASSATYLNLGVGGNTVGAYVDYDNISVKIVEADRSVRNSALTINGTITKSEVAAAAQLVAYSGWSGANYLQQPYSSALDFGTGEWTVGGWARWTGTTAGTIADRSAPTGPRITFGVTASGQLTATAFDGTTARTVTATQTYNTGLWTKVRADYRAGRLSITVNGQEVAVTNGAPLLTLSNPDATLTIGNSRTLDAPFPGSLALWRMGATVPSADQSQMIYRTEWPLFQPGAKCLIDGTSSAVTALAYDQDTDELHVGTSWGRSTFHDLLRVDSAATATGGATSLSATGGMLLSGNVGASVYVPAQNLRDELKRREEARKALGKEPVFFDFDTVSFAATTASGSNVLTSVASVVGTPYIGMGITGTGIPGGATITGINGSTYYLSANATASGTAVAMGQSSFTLQQGYTAKAVYAAEALKREGATRAYTRAFDGFRETVNFGVAPASAVWVSVMAIRSN